RPARLRARPRPRRRDPGHLARAGRGRSLAVAPRPRARSAGGGPPAPARQRSEVASSPMAARKKREERPLPPPLPPAQRTVGQLVGEATRAYGARFWRGLALGVPVVVANALVWQRSSDNLRLAVLPLTAVLVSISYVMAIGLVNGVPIRSRRAVVPSLGGGR